MNCPEVLHAAKIEKSRGHDKAMWMLCLIGMGLMAPICRAEFEKQQHGARTVALANAATVLPSNTWAMFYNPAMMGMAGRSVSAYYSPAPFDLSELALASFAYNEPFSFGAVGVGFSTRGFEKYHATTGILSFSGRLDRSFHYGFAANYHALNIERYGSTGVLAFDAGIAVTISSRVLFGAFLTNLNQPTIGKAVPERLPLVFSAGLSYQISSDITVLADVQKDIRNDANIRLGIEYVPMEFLALRVGSATDPSVFSAGIGVRYEGLEFDYAFTNHPDLGGTHAIGLTFRFVRE